MQFFSFFVDKLFLFYNNNFKRTRAWILVENKEQIKNKAEPEALSWNVFLEKDAEVFHQQMGIKVPFLVSLRRIDSVNTFFIDLRQLEYS